MGFVHLHTHSYYSFFDSTLTPQEIVRLAGDSGAGAVAMTDTNNLTGAVVFYKAANEARLKPILGAEITQPLAHERTLTASRVPKEYSALMSDYEQEPVEAEAPSQQAALFKASCTSPVHVHDHKDVSASPALCRGDSSRRVILLARNFEGYSEISHIITRRTLDEKFDLLQEVQNLTGNVIALSDSPEVLQAVAQPGASEPVSPISPISPIGHIGHIGHINTAGVEATSAPHPTSHERQNTSPAFYGLLIPSRRRRRANRAVYDLAKTLGLPLTITCDVRIASPEDAPLHTLLQAMRRLTTIHHINEEEQIDPAQHFRSAQDVAAFLGIGDERRAHDDELHSDLREAFLNTGRIAAQCDCRLPLGEWKFLRFQGLREPPRRMLRELVERGIRERYGSPPPPEVIDRMNYELSVIEKLRFTEYFLLVNRIVEEACARGFNIVGRGSAANSIVSYALRFTNVCPIRYNLYFERFLNPERNAPPDIDIDFSWRERDDILTWCFDFFGRDKVALISTIQTLQARQAIREVAKAHGIAENEVNAFNKLQETGFRIEETANGSRETMVHNLAQEEPWHTIIEQARRLTDFPRHLSIHCGGIIIAPRNVVDFVPLTTSAKGFVITQMDMFSIEDLGLIKIDLLSNRSLGVLRETVESVERNQKRREEMQPTISFSTRKQEQALKDGDSDCGLPITDCGTALNPEVFRREAVRMKLAGTRRGTSVALAGILQVFGKDAGTSESTSTSPSPSPSPGTETGTETGTESGQDECSFRDPCRSLIRRRVFDFEYVTNDPATRALIDSGRTMGCFYIESPGMRALFERLRCRNFDEVVAASSIIRPGVAESGMMQEYIARHQSSTARPGIPEGDTQRAALPGSRTGARTVDAPGLQGPPLPPDLRSPTTLIPHDSASERLANGTMPINAHAKSRPLADYIRDDTDEPAEKEKTGSTPIKKA